MKVEIWSDVVCPWCYIGKRRVEAALARFEHRDEVDLVWRSFELDPQAPPRHSGAMADRLAEKYGTTRAQAEAMNARVAAVAAGDGLAFHLESAQSGNTFDAHRLLHHAAAHGRQADLKERLMHAYFTEGRAIGDAEVLVEIAGEAGLDRAGARAVLASDAYAADVRADERRAAALGIRGVPFVVIDGQYGVSGAQASGVFLEALEHAWAAARPLTLVGGTADATACEGDECTA
ncbi:MAG: protein disulfide isomerase FrnE [Chloroflexota bacterium]